MAPRLQLHRAALAAAGAILMTTVAQAQTGFDANGQCVGDADGNGQVTITEVITAVNNALSGCQFVPVTLQFRANVGDEPFACGNIYHGVGTSAADIMPSDFRFYIYNIRLVTTDGKEVALRLEQDHLRPGGCSSSAPCWQLDDLVLLDFEDKVRPCNEGTPQTNTTVRGMAAPGHYTGVRFVLGVPFSRNHADEATAPSPLNLSGMFWSWQDGYKFLRIDTVCARGVACVDPLPGDDLLVHLGSTGCVDGTPGVVASCARPNRAEINLNGFDPSANTIVADLAALLADSDINANQQDTPPGCQSDPGDSDCEPIFRNLGINFSDGSPSAATQKFFRVE